MQILKMNNTHMHVCLCVHMLLVEREGYESADSPPSFQDHVLFKLSHLCIALGCCQEKEWVREWVWIMRSRREKAREPGPLQPAARHTISQPLPAGSHGAGYTHTHTRLTSPLLLQHSSVSQRGSWLRCTFPSPFSAFQLHPSQPTLCFLPVFHSLPSPLYIILHLPCWGFVTLSHALVVSPLSLSLQFILTSICLSPNLLKLLKKKPRDAYTPICNHIFIMCTCTVKQS